MKIATLLDRGELTAGDINDFILNGQVETVGILARTADNGVGLGTTTGEEHRKRLKQIKEKRRGWTNNVEDLGGKLEALIESID